MNCPCGGQTEHRTHRLITLHGARAWLPTATPDCLPLRIEADRCTACGRQLTDIYRDDRVIERRG